MNFTPHQSKPDIDNLCKQIMDSLSNSDQTVYRIIATKYWSFEGKIIVNR